MTLLGVALIGLLVGFLSGLLGKGGSSIATPMLHAIGIPAIIAVASPLPATVPSTLAAGYVYAKERLIDWRIVRWSIGFGAPATVVGVLASTSVPFSFLGARVALRTDPFRLERLYGIALVVLGTGFLVLR